MEEQAEVIEEDEAEDDADAAIALVDKTQGEDEAEESAVEDEAPVEDLKGKGKASMSDRLAKFKDLRARMVSGTFAFRSSTPAHGL